MRSIIELSDYVFKFGAAKDMSQFNITKGEISHLIYQSSKMGMTTKEMKDLQEVNTMLSAYPTLYLLNLG